MRWWPICSWNRELRGQTKFSRVWAYTPRYQKYESFEAIPASTMVVFQSEADKSTCNVLARVDSNSSMIFPLFTDISATNYIDNCYKNAFFTSKGATKLSYTPGNMGILAFFVAKFRGMLHQSMDFCLFFHLFLLHFQ